MLNRQIFFTAKSSTYQFADYAHSFVRYAKHFDNAAMVVVNSLGGRIDGERSILRGNRQSAFGLQKSMFLAWSRVMPGHDVACGGDCFIYVAALHRRLRKQISLEMNARRIVRHCLFR